MTKRNTNHVDAHTLKSIGRQAAEYASSLLAAITEPNLSYLFHDAEDGQTISLARRWLDFAGACANVVNDLAEQGTHALDEATVSLIADPHAQSITVGTNNPEHGPEWSIRYPADPDVLGIDIAALVRDNL